MKILGLFLVLSLSQRLTYLDEKGEGVQVVIYNNPYDPAFWITRAVKLNCGVNLKDSYVNDCWWISSGDKGCSVGFIVSWSMNAVSTDQFCQNHSLIDCIKNQVDQHLCSYSFWMDDFFWIISGAIFVILMVFVIVSCRRCYRRRQTFIQTI